ncbi:hypothetical protein ACFHWW_26530 [Ensifer sp. P24N7]|uniref:hypothetical protein n=1 Tax=Sinorhizobium sp. P24N7 TaxID=3348358 RepID=UPI0035F28DBC
MGDWIRERNFSSLSMRDLLDAREAYHVHLANLDNVFATAIGRYLIRDEDPDAKSADKAAPRGSSGPRTLYNSRVQKWSWPCVLVFVDTWQDRAAFSAKPEAMVPQYLYLPDGRVIPTCVVYAESSPRSEDSQLDTVFPTSLLGGGFPALQMVQGRRRMSTMGCLVTDGDQVYVLTNRHVTGEAGREAFTVVGDARQRVGISIGRDLGKVPFPEAYPGWPGSRQMLNLDAGLIRIDDVTRWTAQVYGIGEIGPIIDLHVDTFDLDLIDKDVRAYGAAGGLLKGRIQAFFFRYRSVGGIDYVSDFLIGARRGETSVGTRPGDSGTLWFLEPDEGTALPRGERAPRLRPFAMQWGGQALTAPGAELSGTFALATCLSTISRELDVEVIADWNVGHPETWGAVGHFKVGALACDLVEDEWLRELFMLNQRNIGYDDVSLQRGLGPHPRTEFVPLADVADFVWRSIRRADDNNHFADIDEVAESGEFEGKSLLELTKDQPEKVHPDIWNAFYESIGANKRGALPFRAWQIFDEMTELAADGRITEFVCAAGLLAHYIGDACQPLHVSKLHHGSSEVEADVHSAYETAMLNQFTDELIAALAETRATWTGPEIRCRTGHDAAVATVELMRRTVERLPPERVIEVFNESAGRNRTKKMWQALGEDTVKCIFDGSLTLARIWEGAWKAGRSGRRNPRLPQEAESQEALMALYLDNNFLLSSKLQVLTEREGRLVTIAT